jgi:drug/metabolite transporter (DMT)-like permease
MTPLSIAIALAVTLLTGLAGGWLFRERTTGRHWSFAVAATIGLFLFRASSVDDLFGNLIPASALGWVPWIALSVAGVQTIAHQRV